MRVVMVCRKYSGVGRQSWLPSGTPAVTKLIEEFERRGHRTTVLFLSKASNGDESGPRDLQTTYNEFKHVEFIYLGWRGARGIPAILSDIVNDTRQFFRILPHLIRRVDIVYFDRAHLGYAALTSLLRRNVVWRCLGVMSFVIARDAGKRAGALYLLLARLLVRFPMRLMICTNDGSPWFRAFPRGSRKRLLLLTNGVDRCVDNKAIALDFGKVPLIGFVGRATFTKGLDIFIGLCAELKTRNIAFRAVVIGDGHFLADAMRMAEESGISQIVEFTGSVPHTRIGEYFRAIDVYVTPARNGAFSNTTIEALAAGCSVVALSPAPDTAVDKTTMAFLPADVVRWARHDNPVQSFADAVAELVATPNQLAERRSRGLAFAQATMLDWSERIRREADILEDLARGGAVPHGAMAADVLARKAFEVAA